MAAQLNPPRFRLVSWILRHRAESEYNLSDSGLPEPQLERMGVDTSLEAFSLLKDDHEAQLANTLADVYGVEPSNVVITSGASESILLVYLVFGRGRGVVPLPNYEPMFLVPAWLKMKVTSRVDGPAVPGAVYGLTDPNNPTGLRLGEGAVDRLGELSKKSTVFVNETYGEFAFARPRTIFSRYGRIITCSSLTKFFGLGRLRVGWVMAGKRKSEMLQRGRRLTTGHNSEYSLWLAKQILERRGAFVERARRIHGENLTLVKKFLESTPGIEAKLPDAAPFCLVKYRDGPDSVTLAKELLEKRGVLVAPGDYFGAPRSFRLCFTAPREKLATGLEELTSFMSSLT